ncbi:class I SAM-dependent methyltransferase [Hydrogenophaga electricum]|uniref:Ubiquinone/menaquinone biosynthesis C-methyltransferase UbiE n=1 Tax=Hydrogenophaga electricum TaxID=1230953 RepID=A0ABQ6CEN4_9BURK|nr:class I SAM-dependent methyltransferase [Hydrogenophaga electricum]GLS16761.1 ubiquinone/menaquinone biosynthesis C-methyltransferase UbiE [Hydrogenophaga electricum]
MNDSRRLGAMVDTDRLRGYFEGEDERRRVTRALFDEGASGYDHAESLTALGSGAWYRRQVLQRAGLREGMTLLDVAAGTGLVTVAGHALTGPSGRVIALDPSPGMLAELKKKLSVETLEAYAEAIPLPDAEVDFLSMGYALRHVGDLDRAFAEYRRVLKPGGQVCLMEISRPASRLQRALLGFHIGAVVPALARLSGRHADIKRLWRYYGDTIEAALAPQPILDALQRAGFTDVKCSVTLGMFREYTARKP